MDLCWGVAGWGSGSESVGEEWVVVEGVEDRGERVDVYNFRVADFHTYFVGALDWGFSVSAHNIYDDKLTKADAERALKTNSFRSERAKTTDLTGDTRTPMVRA